MAGIDLSNEQTIRDLIDGMIEWKSTPWSPSKDSMLFYVNLCTDVCKELGLASKNEFESYGSGFASFLDAWFYVDDPKFRIEEPGFAGPHFSGLFVLLNRDYPLYVVGEGSKSWNDRGASSYLPDAQMVDHFTNPAVKRLSLNVEQKLSERGMIRLSSVEVMQPIPEDIEIVNDKVFQIAHITH